MNESEAELRGQSWSIIHIKLVIKTRGGDEITKGGKTVWEEKEASRTPTFKGQADRDRRIEGESRKKKWNH